MQRLWLQSMTPAAIRDGFAHLRSDAEMQPLADAARCRSEADWLVGINGTRAMTAFNSKGGGFFLTTVGRVQTPTLSIVVEREEKIRRFVPRDYWEVKRGIRLRRRACTKAAGSTRNSSATRSIRSSAIRGCGALPAAETIVAACRGKTGTVTEESKPSTQLSPLLFDLTSLQREANGRFGFSAKNTLGLAQALYEKHKVLTYPAYRLARVAGGLHRRRSRTRSRMLKESNNYLPHAKQVLDKGWVKPNKRIFDNSKISDHFAIIPTLQAPKKLSEPEQKLYDLVVKRFLSVFFPAAEYQGDHADHRSGRPSLQDRRQGAGRTGLAAGLRPAKCSGEDANLVPVQKDEKVKTDKIAAHGNW